MRGKKYQGSGLLEVVVAMAIIIVVLIGILSRTSMLASWQKDSFDRTKAVFLAREALEVVRNIRDTNWLRGCSSFDDPEKCFYWDSGLLAQTATYYWQEEKEMFSLQPLAENFEQCRSSGSCRLFFSSSGELSYEQTALPSNFYRVVKVSKICQEQADCQDGICEQGESCFSEEIGIEVSSLVSWKDGENWKNLELKQQFFNWR